MSRKMIVRLALVGAGALVLVVAVVGLIVAATAPTVPESGTAPSTAAPAPEATSGENDDETNTAAPAVPVDPGSPQADADELGFVVPTRSTSTEDWEEYGKLALRALGQFDPGKAAASEFYDHLAAFASEAGTMDALESTSLFLQDLTPKDSQWRQWQNTGIVYTTSIADNVIVDDEHRQWPVAPDSNELHTQHWITGTILIHEWFRQPDGTLAAGATSQVRQSVEVICRPKVPELEKENNATFPEQTGDCGVSQWFSDVKL